SGYLRGVINADFLIPLSGRTGFEMDANWWVFMSWLKSVEPSIRAEVEDHRLEEEIERLEAVKDDAKRLAEELLEAEPFQQLELLGGMRRKRSKKKLVQTNPQGKETGKRVKKKTGDKRDPSGLRFGLKEVPLDDVWRHSIFEAGLLKVNTRNPNYMQWVERGTKRRQTRYMALMIGKETTAYNDKSGDDYYLEKLLAFSLMLESKMAS
ncbi:unnamed protein product, partial [marine sediment metagenome]